MKKMEKETVSPSKPIIYERYVDDCFHRRKKGDDSLFIKLNNYHPNINFTVDDLKTENKFLDTKLIDQQNGFYRFKVNRKKNKFPTHWSSKVPKRYKRNAINGDLHRAKRISSDFETEKHEIKEKFKSAGFPLRFIESVLRNFENKQNEDITPGQPIDDRILYRLKLPYCEENEKLVSKFIEKLNYFTENKYKYFIIWQTRKIRSLFPLKDKKLHRSDVIYEGMCECEEFYIGETERNDNIRFKEHGDIRRNSAPANHIATSFGQHTFTWRIIRNAPKNRDLREIIESFFVAKRKPSLTKETRSLILFKNGIT